MALGGGTFLTQNKVLPGSYINVISAALAGINPSDRGVVAMPVSSDWGVDGEVFTVDASEVIGDSLKIFGYAYTDAEMLYIREVFRKASRVRFYRLNTGTKATATVGTTITATAKHSGTLGNEITVTVAANIDQPTKFDVSTYFKTLLVDVQTVALAEELVGNDYVDFSGTGAPVADAGTDLTTGTNGTVTGTEHQAALTAFEAYGFNTLVCPTDDSTTIDLYVAYVKDNRDNIGKKFQAVVYRKEADYEGVINVQNVVTDTNAAALVFWTAGAIAGAQINQSVTNAEYDGELTVNVDYSQSELETELLEGKFIFHRVGDEIRVLSDINSLTTFTPDKSKDFQSNQVIRVVDDAANNIAATFNNFYLGKLQNNAAGRTAFWNDIVNYNQQLQDLQAIENFNPDELTVEAGADKDAVVVNNPLDIVVAMAKLYMTIVVQ